MFVLLKFNTFLFWIKPQDDETFSLNSIGNCAIFRIEKPQNDETFNFAEILMTKVICVSFIHNCAICFIYRSNFQNCTQSLDRLHHQ